MIRDKWVGRKLGGWQKMIHHGLIHSSVTLSPNVSEPFYTRPWYAGTGPLLHSGKSKRQRQPRLPLPTSPWAPLTVKHNHVPGRIRSALQSEVLPRGELSCANSGPVLPDDHRLLQQTVRALIRLCRAQGYLRICPALSDEEPKYEFTSVQCPEVRAG